MASEALGGERRIAAALSAATPILFTGLATAIAFRGGVFNVGVEGCFYLGGLVAAVIGYGLAGLSGVLIIGAAMVTAAAVGALWMAVPGVLKARLGVDEVVSTLMLNFVAINLTAFLVNGPLLAPGPPTRRRGPSSRQPSCPAVAAVDGQPRLPDRARFHRRLCLVEPLHRIRLRDAARRSEPVLLPCRRHRRAAPDRVDDDPFRPDRRARRRPAHPRHRPSLRRRLLAGLWLHRHCRRPPRPQLGGRHHPRLAPLRRSRPGGTTVQLFSDIPIEIVQVLQGTVMVFAVAQLGRLWSRHSGRAA